MDRFRYFLRGWLLPAVILAECFLDQTTVSASTQQAPHETVLIIGSSVSKGWRDTAKGGGFLKRAFAALSNVNDARYTVVNKSIPGHGVLGIVGKYTEWLAKVHPSVVVLGWGGLDDLHDKVPIETIRNQVQWEITTALAAQSAVLVVTPPVSEASYKGYSTLQPYLLQNEISVAEGEQSPNVYVFDVFSQMKQYLANHQESVTQFAADGWHPNAAGHRLAGAILTADLIQQFGVNPIKFQPGTGS